MKPITPRTRTAPLGGLITPWFLAAVAPALALGCTGITFVGHFAVLAVTLGIFVGTLSLNKARSSDSKTTNVDGS
jgi:hypothetical protein